MSLKRWWGEFTARQFEGLDADRVVAVLPIAAVEQHGPHLPVFTDAAIQQGMLETAIALIPAELDVRILPVQAVGKSNEHLWAPGTLTISAETLIGHWCELGESVARAGVRKLVIVNSHGGNEAVMDILARELRVRQAMLAVKTSWMRFGTPPGLYSDAETRYGIHGGDVETSLMLHFQPQTVDMGQARDFRSRVEEAHSRFGLLAHTGTHAFGWIASDLNPEGAVGEAHLGTAEKGAATAAWQAQGFVRLLEEVAAARLSEWLQKS